MISPPSRQSWSFSPDLKVKIKDLNQLALCRRFRVVSCDVSWPKAVLRRFYESLLGSDLALRQALAVIDRNHDGSVSAVRARMGG